MLSSRPIHLEDGPHFPTKTPGRGLKNRAENAHAGVPMTVHGKGKNVAPKTPFQPSSVQPQRLFKDQKIVLGSSTRPLGDKTPMPNRVGRTLFQTPLPQKSKLSKLSIIEAAQQEASENDGDEPPGSMQRPSSLRTHLKHPRMLNPKDFQTPVNKGNHWDISDGDIVVPDAETLQQEPIVDDEDDFDEVEYGPPNTLDIPYQPPFDFELPDYKEVGKTLRRIAFSVPYDDTPALPDPEVLPSDLCIELWDMISLPPLESDDPFHLARLEAEAAKLKSQQKPTLVPTRPLPRTQVAPPPRTNRPRSLTDSAASKPRPQATIKPPITQPVNTKAMPPPPPTSSAIPRSRAATLSKPTSTTSKAPAAAPTIFRPPQARATAPTSQALQPRPGAPPSRPGKPQIQGQNQAAPTSRAGIRPHTSLALTTRSKPFSTTHPKTSSVATTRSLTSVAEGAEQTRESSTIFKFDDVGLGVGDEFMFEV